ncbi:hypothetical protein N0V90_008778 [Kalmusia sp. IMI 367209]|nr:hypothetical protein N0V90_008778 [Kalmusia sp. IMI 367209]
MSYSDSIDERATFLDEEKCKNSPDKRALSPRSFKLLTICNIVFFLASLSLYSSSWLQHSATKRPNAKLRQVHSYSPLLDAVDLPLEVKALNGTLYPNHHPSVARGPPSPEADAIWNEWEITRVYAITADQIRAMGKDPSTATKLEDDIYGLGDDAYASTFDIYHQLHCLNMLRKLVYPDYYKNARMQFPHAKDPQAMYEIHMGHCIDMLMQTIQCSGNLNLITMHWVNEEAIPFPDMSINKQCVADFDYLTKWRKEHQVDPEKYVAMKKPAGVKQLPEADMWYKYFRPDKVNPNHINGANPDDDFNL